MNKRALIFGITGQDGSYLAELLLSKGYEVHGVIRRSSSFNTRRIDHVFESLTLHHGDVTDASRVARIIEEVQPGEVYNLAAQSHVRTSFDLPVYTAQTVAMGSLHVLEAIRGKDIRFYNASSSEIFGNAPAPQDEQTRHNPRSPYACAKVMAHNTTKMYREAYGMFAVNGILFNHESPRRGETFVTRKITRALTRIACGLQESLTLGNLDAKRDWGFAGDYVRAMWLMLQQAYAEDFVIATGDSYSVADFLEFACKLVDISPGVVIHDPKYQRPLEIDELCGDASNARLYLDWSPTITFPDLVRMMVTADMVLARTEKLVRTVPRKTYADDPNSSAFVDHIEPSRFDESDLKGTPEGSELLGIKE